MMINNFELIKSLLSFNTSDEFYMIQILQRGKDHQDAKSSSEVRVIKSYFINSFDYLDNRKEEIIKLCEIFNARAYINLNKKNFKQISMKGLELMSIEEAIEYLMLNDRHIYLFWNSIMTYMEVQKNFDTFKIEDFLKFDFKR